MTTWQRRFSQFATCLAMALAAHAAPAAEDVTIITGAKIHVGDGRVIANASVLIEGGVIRAIGPSIPVPSGATVIDAKGASITPGLIDAAAMVESEDAVSRQSRRLGVEPPPESAFMMLHRHDMNDQCFCDGFAACDFADFHSNLAADEFCPVCATPASPEAIDNATGLVGSIVRTEASSETVPHTRVIDAIDLRSPDLRRLVGGGVTTVFVMSDNSAVIGPRGAILRTGGPIRERIIRDEDAVCAAIGSDPIRIGLRNSGPTRNFVSTRTRRPTTRMGVAWVFRKAFYDAIDHREGRPITGADAPPDAAFPTLIRILAGEVPLRIHARQQNDILTALRFASEFGFTFTLVEATDAWKCLDDLREANVPVIFGPIYIEASGMRGFSGETNDSRLTTLGQLIDAGIETALTAQDLREEDGLARQAMYAIRAGVSPERALAAVTSTPAKILGLDETLGTIEVGKGADIVLWNGEPLEATSSPSVVLIQGRIVLDRRE